VTPLSIVASAAIAPELGKAPGPHRVNHPPAPDWISKGVLRRLSRLGLLALGVVESVLKESGVSIDDQLGLVVGTGLADLDETLGFLQGLHTRGERFASPQMFQRSVHSAVAGELAIVYGLTGYNVTISQGLASGEAALFQAALAVASGRCRACLCVAVDGVSEGLLTALAAMGLSPDAAGEGAAALLLQAEREEAAAAARLVNVDLKAAERSHSGASLPRGTHGALGLVQTVQALQGLPGAAFPAGVEVQM